MVLLVTVHHYMYILHKLLLKFRDSVSLLCITTVLFCKVYGNRALFIRLLFVVYCAPVLITIMRHKQCFVSLYYTRIHTVHALRLLI